MCVVSFKWINWNFSKWNWDIVLIDDESADLTCWCSSLPVQASEDHMKKHYLDLKDMPFYAGLCKYMSSGPIFAMVTLTQTHVNTHTLRSRRSHTFLFLSLHTFLLSRPLLLLSPWQQRSALRVVEDGEDTLIDSWSVNSTQSSGKIWLIANNLGLNHCMTLRSGF